MSHVSLSSSQHGHVFSSNGEVKRSESATLSTQLFWKKVHYSKLFKTVYAVAI